MNVKFSNCAVTELDFSFGSWGIQVSALAVSSLSSMFPFAAKNLLVNLLHPGSLVVVNSKVISLKMDPGSYSVIVAAQQLLVWNEMRKKYNPAQAGQNSRPVHKLFHAAATF